MKLNSEWVIGLFAWGGIIAAVWYFAGSNKPKPPERPAVTAAADGTLEAATETFFEVKAVPTGDGLYLVTYRGIWLIKGNEAIMVKQAPASVTPR